MRSHRETPFLKRLSAMSVDTGTPKYLVILLNAERFIKKISNFIASFIRIDSVSFDFFI